MTCAVRYYSKSGNTKKIAEAIAEAIGVEAISIDSPDAPINEKVDILFVGGAVYAYGIDKSLSHYINTLCKENVGRVVAFSTAMMSRHALDLIRRGAQARDIKTSCNTLFVKSKDVDDSIEIAKDFARSVVAKILPELSRC